jgi:hypothetical protein
MMHRRYHILIGALCVAFMLITVFVEPALAAPAPPTTTSSPSDTGNNISGVLRDVVNPVLFSTAGIMMLAALFKRSWEMALTVGALTIFAGSFLIDNPPWVSVVNGVSAQIAH